MGIVPRCRVCRSLHFLELEGPRLLHTWVLAVSSGAVVVSHLLGPHVSGSHQNYAEVLRLVLERCPVELQSWELGHQELFLLMLLCSNQSVFTKNFKTLDVWADCFAQMKKLRKGDSRLVLKLADLE